MIEITGAVAPVGVERNFLNGSKIKKTKKAKPAPAVEGLSEAEIAKRDLTAEEEAAVAVAAGIAICPPEYAQRPIIIQVRRGGIVMHDTCVVFANLGDDRNSIVHGTAPDTS